MSIHNAMRSFQTVKLFYEFKMSAWLELSMNNTLISVSDPLNIWPQNNKQILYYLTQFYQTPDFLGKKKKYKKNPKPLSVSTVVETQIIFPKLSGIAEHKLSEEKRLFKNGKLLCLHPPARIFKGTLLFEKEM